MAAGVLALINICAARGSVDETKPTNTFSILTDFSGSAILLLVAAWLTRGLYTDLALETVLVAVAHLGAEPLQAPLPLGTVCVDLALEVAQPAPALVARGALASRAPRGYPHTPLLGPRHPGKPLGTCALNILVGDLAQSVGAARSLLLARVDALEVDADLVRGAVLVVPAAGGAHAGAADLAGGALLAGDAGDHAHAGAALLPHQAVILPTTRVPTRARLTRAAAHTVSVGAAHLAVADTRARVQRAGDKSGQTLKYNNYSSNPIKSLQVIE